MCPMGCNGDVVYLGRLGKLYWYRCRYCWAEFSSEVELAADFINEEA